MPGRLQAGGLDSIDREVVPPEIEQRRLRRDRCGLEGAAEYSREELIALEKQSATTRAGWRRKENFGRAEPLKRAEPSTQVRAPLRSARAITSARASSPTARSRSGEECSRRSKPRGRRQVEEAVTARPRAQWSHAGPACRSTACSKARRKSCLRMEESLASAWRQGERCRRFYGRERARAALRTPTGPIGSFSS